MLIKPIKFDLNKYRLYEKLKAKQGDTESRFLFFQLLDGSLPFNLENRSVRAYMIKPDGKEVFNDLIVNDRVKGYCTLELTNQVLAAPGIVKLELMVIEGTKKLTSSVFELEVEKSINSEKSIVSTNEFGALLKGLASLNEYDNYKNEIAEARDGEKNLLTKVKKIDEQLAENKSETEKNFNSIEDIKINKQEKTDENLNTNSKEIVGAINEVNDNEVIDVVSKIAFASNINKNGRNSLIKDKRGMVVLELSVKFGDGNTNGIANAAVFATLPVGYRPKQKIERPGYVYQTNQGLSVYVSNFRINPDGTICYNVSYPPAIAEAVNMAELAVVYYV